MAVEVKFCGLTRRADAQLGVRLGAHYLGVIFAGGPRHLTARAAADVFVACKRSARRVGVFGRQSVAEMLETADEAGLDVLQLHQDPDARLLSALRAATSRELWAVVRIAGTSVPADSEALFELADAVVLDARVGEKLGGSGVALDWRGLARDVAARRGSARLVVAGGLTDANVGDAIGALAPDVVDVSSGIESAPGVKSPPRMRNFLRAVERAQVMT